MRISDWSSDVCSSDLRMGVMADEFHGHPSRAMAMVGVTGTSGKTSTVQLLAQAWTLLGTRSGTVGTLGAGLYGETVATGFRSEEHTSELQSLMRTSYAVF